MPRRERHNLPTTGDLAGALIELLGIVGVIGASLLAAVAVSWLINGWEGTL